MQQQRGCRVTDFFAQIPTWPSGLRDTVSKSIIRTCAISWCRVQAVLKWVGHFQRCTDFFTDNQALSSRNHHGTCLWSANKQSNKITQKPSQQNWVRLSMLLQSRSCFAMAAPWDSWHVWTAAGGSLSTPAARSPVWCHHASGHADEGAPNHGRCRGKLLGVTVFSFLTNKSELFKKIMLIQNADTQ